MKKRVLAILLVTMTVLAGCNTSEPTQVETKPITNTLKAVTDKVTGAVENVEEKTVEINDMTCMQKVFSEDNEAFCVFYTVRDGVKTVTGVKPSDCEDALQPEDTMPVLEFNDQWVKFNANDKTYLADIESNSEFILNEDGSLLERSCYTLLLVPEDTELPKVVEAEKEEV